MRNLLFIASLLYGITMVAQEQNDYFVFDRILHYEENDTNQVQLYFNINDANYYLFLYDSPEGRTAKIYDRWNDKIHYYMVKPLQESNGLIYEYDYDRSENYDENNNSHNFEYSFETTRDDAYYRFANLNIYNNSDNNKAIVSAKLTMRYTHEDMFSAFNLCCLVNNGSFHKIVTDDNYVVVKAVVLDKDGMEHTYKLVDDQVIQFKLKVPQEAK